MTRRTVKNMVASVHQRLLTISKEKNRPFNDLLQLYALERWLFRLSQSSQRDRFVLKGALLLVAWNIPSTRPTRDIDLLGNASNELEAVRVTIAEITATPVDDDGLKFDPATVVTERIAEDADYEGVRAKFQGLLGNSRIAMQIDIGFSDVITPGPSRTRYPTLLDQPAAELLTYNRETAIAEKFEAMVKLGELNSRMKDFFDVWLLSKSFSFDGPLLSAAVQATFSRRQTLIEIEPVCFAERFVTDANKTVQWKAFVRRSLLTEAPDFKEIVATVRHFLQPVAQAISEQRPLTANWPLGGPWQEPSLNN